jgi:hypothetical protein
MKRRTKIVIAVGVVLAVGLTVWIRSFVHHISSPRIVARAVTSDGAELCIVQQCNWSPEPFTTSFIYRKPGSEWRRFYYDHQDTYWGTGRISLDTNAHVAVVYRGGSPAVTFYWDSEIYTMHRWNRTLTNAQWKMSATWTPQMSVYSDR